jgi:glycosyltransferase involved in cell wall biosynthesis
MLFAGNVAPAPIPSYRDGVPRRLLLLNTDLELGGTPTVVRELARRLHDPPCVRVEVACLGRRGPVANQISELGINVTAFDARRSRDLFRVVRQLVDHVRDRRIDTVLSFLMHANTVAALARKKCGQVRFFQSIQTTQAYPQWHWLMQRFAQRAAERIIVPSPSVAAVAEKRAGVSAERITVIPNAIDPDDFSPSTIAMVDPRPFPIGFLGRFDPVKRIPDLLQAVSQLGDLVHLHLFGDGQERGTIERIIRDPKLEHRVTLHGTVPRPQEALAQMGLLVLPSINEGMPMVLIEAMAAGVPVIGRDVPGVRDVIVDGENGLLVSSLAEGIARMVHDIALRQELIVNARRWVRERFTWEIVLGQYRDALSL